jgi:Flp pilus assembly pilin Flp
MPVQSAPTTGQVVGAGKAARRSQGACAGADLVSARAGTGPVPLAKHERSDMQAVTRALGTRFLGERGATAVEYALVTALIAMVIGVTVYVLGINLSFVFDAAGSGLATPGPAAPGAPGTGAPPAGGYEDCDAVRAAGAAPIRVGDPGYSPELDPDGDGVGCE